MIHQTQDLLSSMADRELSLASRLGYVTLLLAALMMSAVIGALWLTEPALPLRTQAAFAVLLLIGASWIGFAIWVLASRRVLLAHQGVVASCLALGCSALFMFGSLAIALGQDSRAAWGAAGVGLVMVAAAAALLVAALRKVARLQGRRRQLERELAV